VIEGLKLKLMELGPDMRFSAATTATELMQTLAAEPGIDVAIVDLSMPGASGLSHIEAVRHAHPTLPLVVLSGSEDPAVMRRALDLGVMGFIPKAQSPDVMLSAIRLVLSGGIYVPPNVLGAAAPLSAGTGVVAASSSQPPSIEALRNLLTERQIDVLRLLSGGKPNKLIAREIGISEGTVKIHLAAIYRALNARNRTEAVVIAQRMSGL
jgi:DNA-binding NarL/FixJ family response regulator